LSLDLVGILVGTPARTVGFASVWTGSSTWYKLLYLKINKRNLRLMLHLDASLEIASIFTFSVPSHNMCKYYTLKKI